MGQLFRREESDVARDRGKTLQLLKTARPLADFKFVRQVKLGQENACARARLLCFRGGKLTRDAELAVLGENVRGQRKVWIFRSFESQQTQSQRSQCTFEIKQIERPRATTAPIRPALRRPGKEKRHASRLCTVRRRKDTADFKESHTFRAGARVPVEHAE